MPSAAILKFCDEVVAGGGVGGSRKPELSFFILIWVYCCEEEGGLEYPILGRVGQ